MTKFKKEEFWRHHHQQAMTCGLGIGQYCLKHSISKSTFRYWEIKFRNRNHHIKDASGRINKRAIPAFSAVRVVDSSSPVEGSNRKALPDARWVAEIIFQIHSRCQ